MSQIYIIQLDHLSLAFGLILSKISGIISQLLPFQPESNHFRVTLLTTNKEKCHKNNSVPAILIGWGNFRTV